MAARPARDGAARESSTVHLSGVRTAPTIRVVTYARVSSLPQETEGQSIPNQQRAFRRASDERGWVVVRAYREAASAGTVEGRAEFSRMIAELPQTRPDAIVVDTLDRFTRNLLDGLRVLEELRGHGVGLLPLDWRRDRPIDVDDDRDWADVVAEFTAAERERRRIRRRILRSYEGRRERGATTTNRPPFGLRRVGDALVEDPERAAIVREADRRVLAGESFGDVAAWARALDETAWKTRTGVALAIRNRSYVDAGVRDAETQAALDAVAADAARVFGGGKRRHEHEFAGVFACGLCVDAGYAPDEALMHGGFQGGKERIVCDHSARIDPRGHVFYVTAERVAVRWRTYLAGISGDPAFIDRWARAGSSPPDRRVLERRLARLDQRAAGIARRRDAALDLLGDRSPEVVRQVRAALRGIDADEAALHAAREAVRGELAAAERVVRDPDRLRARFARLIEAYERAAPRERNVLARAVVAALGTRPELRRVGAGGKGAGARRDYEVVVSWPGVDELTAGPRASGAARPGR